MIAAGSFEAYHEPAVCMSGFGYRAVRETTAPLATGAAGESGRGDGRARVLLLQEPGGAGRQMVMVHWLQNRDGSTDTGRKMGTYRDLLSRLRTGLGATARGHQTVIVRAMAVVPPGRNVPAATEAARGQVQRNVAAVAGALYRRMRE